MTSRALIVLFVALVTALGLTLTTSGDANALTIDPGGTCADPDDTINPEFKPCEENESTNPGDPNDNVGVKVVLNPWTNEEAHGPFCGSGLTEPENSCEKSKATSNPNAPVVQHPLSPLPNLGAWNAFMVSSSNSAIMADFPTTPEQFDCATADGEPEPPTDCTDTGN